MYLCEESKRNFEAIVQWQGLIVNFYFKVKIQTLIENKVI